MTACYRLHGKHWHIPLLEFAKVVEFRRKGKDDVGRTSSTSVFIGVVPHTSERIAWGADGEKLHFTQTICRRPIETRWCKDWALAVNCAPWKYEVGSVDEFGAQNFSKTTRIQI